ncbi:MAG: ATP-grasp domain-containing protein [Burkholderiales bacterium]|nr:ATP-grasp domain-containing protein [Burkholderiales bacterium]
MRVFAYEDITGGGLLNAPLPPSLAHEGDMMARALLADLAEIPDIDVFTSRDPRLGPPALASGLRVCSVVAESGSFARCAMLADAVWPIAPETNGRLERLSRQVLDRGRILLGSGPDAIRVAASKHRTSQALEKFAVAVVPTFRLNENDVASADDLAARFTDASRRRSPQSGFTDFSAGAAEQWPGSWVVKPDDGAGCQQTRLFHSWSAAVQWVDANSAAAHSNRIEFVIQPFVSGEPCSLSMLCRGGEVQLLSCNHQRVVIRDDQFHFLGSVVNSLHDGQGQFAQLADRIASAIPGLWGYVGVDFILSEDSGAIVLEVNPRLTTSYVGLRASLGCNPAALVLGLLDTTRPLHVRRTSEIKVDVDLETLDAAATGASAEKRNCATSNRVDHVFGWDVGGAHLKAVVLDRDGAVQEAIQRPCRLWLGLQEFDAALAETLDELAFPAASAWHAVTMTGELADCFSSRAEGVKSLAQAISNRLAPARVAFFCGAQGFATAAQLASNAASIAAVASANWLASAQFCASRIGDGLLVDIGSTTTDVVLFASGVVAARGSDDRSRLACDELVYTGIVRTPLAALTSRVPFGGDWQGVMAERFATTADIYRLTGELPDEADQMPAADDAGKSLEDSARRLARMIGADFESAPLGAWQRLAAWFAECQLRKIHAACERVLSSADGRGFSSGDAPLVGAGTGSFVACKLAARMTRRYVDFASLITDPARPSDANVWINACAPAYSVAWLAWQERFSPGKRRADFSIIGMGR